MGAEWSGVYYFEREVSESSTVASVTEPRPSVVEDMLRNPIYIEDSQARAMYVMDLQLSIAQRTSLEARGILIYH